MARLWRAHEPQAALATGALVELGPDEAHHVRRVLRLRPGERLAVFDGRGHEWEGTLADVSPARVTVALGRELADVVEPPLALQLYQSLVRPERLDWVVQKGTELGLTAITLVATARAEADHPSPARLARWQRIAIEAAKQSTRRVVPALDVAAELPAVAAHAAWILDPGAPASLAPCGQPPSRVSIAIGPEGGFTPEEIASATGRGWRSARLGPRILRTETAGLVAATIVLHAWGDLGGGPGAVDQAPPAP